MKDVISIDDFGKLDIRIGEIKKAEPVSDSEKLLRLEVDFGTEIGVRQVIAGIAKFYAPEDLVGSKRVFVVNLEPRQIMGLESQAMLMAAGNEERIVTLVPDKESEVGSKIR